MGEIFSGENFLGENFFDSRPPKERERGEGVTLLACLLISLYTAPACYLLTLYQDIRLEPITEIAGKFIAYD